MTFHQELSKLLSPLPREEAYCNHRIKINSLTGEVMEDLAASRPIFNRFGCEPHEKKQKNVQRDKALWEAEEASSALGDVWEARDQRNAYRAAMRAKKRIFDLAACNEFDLFITMTLDQEKIDRYEYKEIIRRLGQWLDNRVRRRGLRYLIVPELHKDGAIHFHGLVNSEAFQLKRAYRTPKNGGKPYALRDKKGRKVYNIVDWELGFTTAVFTDGDHNAVSHYISKYVTKSFDRGWVGTIGGRYYLHGGKLNEPYYLYDNVDFDQFGGKEYEVPDAGLLLRYGPVRASDHGGDGLEQTDQGSEAGSDEPESCNGWDGRPAAGEAGRDGSGEKEEDSAANPVRHVSGTAVFAAHAGKERKP